MWAGCAKRNFWRNAKSCTDFFCAGDRLVRSRWKGSLDCFQPADVQARPCRSRRPISRAAGAWTSSSDLAQTLGWRTSHGVNCLQFVGVCLNRSGVKQRGPVHSSSSLGGPSSALSHAAEEDRSAADRALKNNASHTKKRDANWIMRARFARHSGQTTFDPRTRHLHECLTALR
jgi:hypothetical protein